MCNLLEFLAVFQNKVGYTLQYRVTTTEATVVVICHCINKIELHKLESFIL